MNVIYRKVRQIGIAKGIHNGNSSCCCHCSYNGTSTMVYKRGKYLICNILMQYPTPYIHIGLTLKFQYLIGMIQHILITQCLLIEIHNQPFYTAIDCSHIILLKMFDFLYSQHIVQCFPCVIKRTPLSTQINSHIHVDVNDSVVTETTCQCSQTYYQGCCG